MSRDVPSTSVAAPSSAPSPDGPSESLVRDVLRTHAIAIAACTAGALLLFWPTIVELVSFWENDPDFSHGFLIPIISVAILWANRKAIGEARASSSSTGWIVILASLCVFFIGRAQPWNVAQRLGMWGFLIGALAFGFGWRAVRVKTFPFAFLLLCIPPPFFLLNAIRLALKDFATRIAASLIMYLGMPAATEGNVIIVQEHRFEVADACTGIRSLMAVTTTAILMAYVFRTGMVKGAVLLAASIPITVAANIVRIIIVAIALVKFDIDLTEGTRHEMVGVFTFCLSLILIWFTWLYLQWTFQPERGKEPS